MSLQRALLGLIVVVLLVGVVPSAVVVDRRLAASLEERARADLATAPRVLAERRAALNDALMMRAKDIAASSALGAAMASGDRTAALRALGGTAGVAGSQLVLIGPDGASWAGPSAPAAAVAATRRREMPVVMIEDSARVMRTLALAPVTYRGQWTGATGLALPLGDAEAGSLAAMTRSDVIIVGSHGIVSAGSLPAGAADAISRQAVGAHVGAGVQELRVGTHRYLAAAAPIADDATVLFIRDLDRELALLPDVRRVVAMTAGVALLVALAIGAIFAGALGRPVRSLAAAAARLSSGDFDAPLEHSSIVEVNRVSLAFDAMRRALKARLAELQTANRQLADNQVRLAALQGELMQRDRLAAAGRLVAQLAHEIRNPIANVRNLLEIVRRRLKDDPEGREFADMAIDELLRLHELAEQMLDLHRPRESTQSTSDAAQVAAEVAALLRAGAGDALTVRVDAPAPVPTAISAAALKQVLGILTQNAREALGDSGTITLSAHVVGSAAVIDVTDNGPGIPNDALSRIFDPFFTTKEAMRGVGLGLFVAEGIVRQHSGRIAASNEPGGGARFRVELPLAPANVVDSPPRATVAGVHSVA